ncbi:hypothetical protein E4K72_14155 [Oxalobacteraceae bacterium OM1]|nr:hypothetical protein E4K72_14155 [Oxalobacteraceae bacterium OM1]
MSRPSFHLTDEQARLLVREMQGILAKHPRAGHGHRPFVRDFLRAVYQATGSTFSPAIYRRLLEIYAPDRRPSTDTLADEKKALDVELAREARAGRELDDATGIELAAVIERAVDHALDRHRAIPTRSPPQSDSIAVAQRDFLQQRLSDVETELSAARTQAVRAAVGLQAAEAARDALLTQLAGARDVAAAQLQRLGELTRELEATRTFAMRAIDGVRGETRAWQERCVFLEGELQRAKQHAEYFRQIAYQRGAAIPPDLRSESKK